VSIPLDVLENIIDTSGVAPAIEKMLPAGVRHRQLTASTLLAGMMLTLEDDRPAHLTRVHAALTALPEPDQARLGVTEEWRTGPHQLTYRQVERTFNLVADALGKQHPDGAPSGDLAGVCDDLLETSIPAGYKDASAALAVENGAMRTCADNVRAASSRTPRRPRRGRCRLQDSGSSCPVEVDTQARPAALAGG